MDWHPIQWGVEILLVTSCYRNWDKLLGDVPLGSYTDFTLPYLSIATDHFSQSRFQISKYLRYLVLKKIVAISFENVCRLAYGNVKFAIKMRWNTMSSLALYFYLTLPPRHRQYIYLGRVNQRK